jgi:hypothetical protein
MRSVARQAIFKRHGLGLDAFGIDLSPTMIELARQAYPHLRFDVGTMTALDLEDNELGGILAMFSTHHTPPDELRRPRRVPPRPRAGRPAHALDAHQIRITGLTPRRGRAR